MERIIFCAVIFYETGTQLSTAIFRVGEGLLSRIPVSCYHITVSEDVLS